MSLATLVVTVVVLLSACAADQPVASSGTSATHTGWLRDRHPDSTLVLDPALLLSGQDAVEAARIAGHLPPDGDLPNDFYVDDDDAATVRFRAAENLRVMLYDCTDACKLVPVSPAAFLDGRAEPHGGSQAFVSLVVRDDEVVRLREIYLP